MQFERPLSHKVFVQHLRHKLGELNFPLSLSHAFQSYDLRRKVETPNKKGRSGVFVCNTSLTICKLMTFERTRRAGLLATPLKQFPLLEFRQRLLQCDFLQHLSHEVLGNGEKDKSPKLHFITPLLRIPWLLDPSRSNLASPLTRIAFRASFRLTVSREFSNVILPCERRNN